MPKLKGGLNPEYIQQISNLSNLNNLKTFEELQAIEKIDTDGYILDDEGNRINDPISLEPIKYEDVILISSPSL